MISKNKMVYKNMLENGRDDSGPTRADEELVWDFETQIHKNNEIKTRTVKNIPNK